MKESIQKDVKHHEDSPIHGEPVSATTDAVFVDAGTMQSEDAASSSIRKRSRCSLSDVEETGSARDSSDPPRSRKRECAKSSSGTFDAINDTDEGKISDKSNERRFLGGYKDVKSLIAAAKDAPTGMVTTPVKRVAALAALTVGDIGPALGVERNSKIEVLWFVSSDQSENVAAPEATDRCDTQQGNEESDSNQDEEWEYGEDTWFPATVIMRTRKRHPFDFEDEDTEEQMLPVYEIRYEAVPPHFPDPSTKEICLLGAHELFDIEGEAVLRWRFKGDDWEHEPEDDEDSQNSHLESVFKSISKGDLKSIREILLQNRLGIETIDIDSEVFDSKNIPQLTESLVNSILTKILKVHGERFSKLPASVQFRISDDVILLKRALIKKVTATWIKRKRLGVAETQEIIEFMMEKIDHIREKQGYEHILKRYAGAASQT